MKKKLIFGILTFLCLVGCDKKEETTSIQFSENSSLNHSIVDTTEATTSYSSIQESSEPTATDLLNQYPSEQVEYARVVANILYLDLNYTEYLTNNNSNPKIDYLAKPAVIKEKDGVYIYISLDNDFVKQKLFYISKGNGIITYFTLIGATNEFDENYSKEIYLSTEYDELALKIIQK